MLRRTGRLRADTVVKKGMKKKSRKEESRKPKKTRVRFEMDLEAEVETFTPFQRDVLRAVLTIPLGQTRSYQWIANKIGRPSAVRAVGQALRKNPFPLIVPCHRVICANGDCGGYAGRQDPRKEALIEMERRIAGRLKGDSSRPEVRFFNPRSRRETC